MTVFTNRGYIRAEPSACSPRPPARPPALPPTARPSLTQLSLQRTTDFVDSRSVSVTNSTRVYSTFAHPPEGMTDALL